MNQEIFSAVDHYISKLIAQETDALKHADQATADAGIPLMNVSPVQGKMLQVFARMCNAKNILELGTLGGYSTIWMANALPDGGKVTTLEVDPTYATVAQKNIEYAGVQDKVEIRVGKALDILPQLAGEGLPPFDMIFIDADKPPYTEYFYWAIKLARPGSIIIADNVIRNAQVLDENHPDEKVQGVQRLNSSLADNKAVTSIILQNVGSKEYDGMVLAVVN